MQDFPCWTEKPCRKVKHVKLAKRLDNPKKNKILHILFAVKDFVFSVIPDRGIN